MQLVDCLERYASTSDTPGEVRGGARTVVPTGARAAGCTAHALAVADHAEIDRRATLGLGALPDSLRLLDDLLHLPLRTDVHTSVLPEPVLRRLAAAPDGCVEFAPGVVRRVVAPPVSVTAAVTTAATWREALTGALAFRPLCRSYLLVTEPGLDLTGHIWEAQVAGVGVLSVPDGASAAVETLPAPPHSAALKAAGWRFAENVWATSTATV